MGLKIIACLTGTAAAVILAYCFYFDQKRRRDPEFKKKLALKRVSSARCAKRVDSKVQILNLQDEEKVQEFVNNQFLQGQHLMCTGKVDEGIHCMATAIAICGQQDLILQMVRPSLQPVIFNMLSQKVDEVRQKMLNRSVNCV